ncbi:unnamed protein product [Prorocentrum cordatum]|uniref:Uncharacterized protein n=1 Tax=Prorocentrum cordatum TaxID=2364126 RepID=A0ABN9UF95_9DINO|nr:unnamed protein product [Polarella glacialis]
MLLLREMVGAEVEPSIIGYNAGISACQKGAQWQQALSLLREAVESELEPDGTPSAAPDPAGARARSSAQAPHGRSSALRVPVFIHAPRADHVLQMQGLAIQNNDEFMHEFTPSGNLLVASFC